MMRMYVVLTGEGRIGASSAEYVMGPETMQLDFPEDFNFERQMDWRVAGGELVYDPLEPGGA